MNMKKTIAAIAACAVAVSAMATTVSAEEGTLHYNLVKTVYKNEGSATYTATMNNMTTTNGTPVVITVNPDFSELVDFTTATYTITGYNMTGTNKTDAFSFVVTRSDNYWSLNRSDWVSEDGKTITIPVSGNSATGIVAGQTYITVQCAVTHSYNGWMNEINTTNEFFNIDNGTGNVKMATTLTAFTQANDAVGEQYPLYTKLNGSSVATTEIIEYLETKDYNLVAKGVSYVNVKAVLNDVIANYDDVTFTFNTATKKVEKASGKYKDDGDYDCTAFGQHLYNLYGDETTGYVYSSAYDWSYYNLFSGALIINDGLSMSLNDTNTFDYGKTSISFNWADVTDGAVVNTYVTFLQSMRLATSTDWYWDSMDVTYANTEAEDTTVDSDAAAEVEDDEIGEEEVTEEEEAPAEEEEEAPAEEEEAPAEEEVVAPAANPGTGNAPIALAVIPVALAAAAVVAKKRG